MRLPALQLQVTKEIEQHNDIVFLKERTNYKSILYKTYFILEYAVTHYNCNYVLKTDDDAFINVKPLLQQLRLLCTTEQCRHERIYMGRMAKASEVMLQPGHKWNNLVFHNHTGAWLLLLGLDVVGLKVAGCCVLVIRVTWLCNWRGIVRRLLQHASCLQVSKVGCESRLPQHVQHCADVLVSHC